MAIMYYVRYPLSLRQVEDILHERGIDVCHETIRYRWDKLGPIVSKELKKKRRRNKRAAYKVLRSLLIKNARPKRIVTDKLKSYKAALKDLNLVHVQSTKQYANNQAENSHLHFLRREKAVYKFRSMGSLQKFTVIQSNFQNHFNHQRHLEKRNTFKNLRQVSLNERNELLGA